MAKDNKMIWVVAIAAVVIIAMMNQQPAQNDNDGPDLGQVVAPDLSFTAKDLFKTGTARTAGIRVLQAQNGDVIDHGTKSLASGTMNADCSTPLTLLYAENETAYYTAEESFQPACVEGTQYVSGEICTIDTAPTVTVYDENEQVNAAGSNEVAIGTDETVTAYVKVKAAADKCYGNPDSGVPANTICFEYLASKYNDVSTNTGSASIPYRISTAITTGNAIKCYKLDKLADNSDSGRIPVTIEANGDPTGVHNITIRIADAGIDVDADTLEVIKGFEDEDNNALGNAGVINDTIHIS